MSRMVFVYLATLVVFGLGLIGVLRVGATLQTQRPALSATQTEARPLPPAVSSTHVPASQGRADITGILQENLRHPLSLLLAQLLTILVATRLLGRLFRKIGQPAVIGEMTAGILLGPSLLGTLSPATMNALFPVSSLDALRLFSQVGVILFMFVVGMELEAGHLRKRADTAVLVSHVSIVFPFFLGATLSLLLYRTLAPAGVPFHAFALFMGIAMSITAFPVLARIIAERGLSNTFLGNTAIACAAIDDVTAWCLLALVVAIAKAQALATALLPISLTLLFVAFMLIVLRPQMSRLLSLRATEPLHERRIIATVLVVMLASAWLTEIIGIHSLFGAFLAGVILPRDPRLHTFLRDRLALFSGVFLLPLFFAYTGLRTRIALLNDPTNWLFAASVILVAVVGKLGGGLIAARWSGLNGPDSFALGSLMNTRGLMELIVLNIGYDMGILSPTIFAMMVLMALTTTFMTSPLLSLADHWRRRHSVFDEQMPSLASKPSTQQ